MTLSSKQAEQALKIMQEIDDWVTDLGTLVDIDHQVVPVFKRLKDFLSGLEDIPSDGNKTEGRFDEYGAYGENNPPVTQEAKPYTTAPDDGYNVTFIEEKHLPDGNVKLTFDVGEKAMQHAGEAGLKLFLYTGALDITLEQAFAAIWETYKGKLDHGE